MSRGAIAILQKSRTPVALDLPENLKFETWIEIGAELALAEMQVGWWIGEWWAFGERKYGVRKAIVTAPEWKGPGFEACVDCATVVRRFKSPRRRGLMTFNHHREVAAKWIEPIQADQLLDQAEEGELVNSDGERKRWSVMRMRAEVRKLRASLRIGELVEVPLPTDAPVHVLYADPPWQYENPPMGGGNRSIENHYPTMTLDELKATDVGACALENALLFMWATAPKLAECLQLLEPWGFTYRTNLVWDKVDIGMGYYARNQHELLLICKRGHLPPPAPELRVPSVYREKATDHSRKPNYYYELIERWYPTLRKRELFSRNPARPGWESPWGNELSMVEAAE